VKEAMMALMRWDPFSTLARLDSDFDQIVRQTWGSSAGFVPAAEIHLDGQDVMISLELPGIDIENDVSVEVADNRLVVSGERRSHTEAKDEKSRDWLVREMRYGAFRREFALPEGMSADDVQAAYEHGILTLRVRNVVKGPTKPVKVPIGKGSSASMTEGHDVISGEAQQVAVESSGS
jgi:HSP20 family protein